MAVDGKEVREKMEKKCLKAVIATDGFPRIDVLAKPIVDWLKTQDPYIIRIY